MVTKYCPIYFANLDDLCNTFIIYAIIATKPDFQYINVCQVPCARLKLWALPSFLTSLLGPGKHLCMNNHRGGGGGI